MSLLGMFLEYGEAVSALPDPFGHGWKTPVESVPADLLDNINALIGSSRLNEQTGQARTMISQSSRNEQLDSVLARRMFNHDAWSLLSILTQASSLFKSDPEARNDPKKVDVFLRGLAKYRLLGTAMTYLASSGDGRFLSFISPDQIQPLLERPRKHVELGQMTECKPVRNSEYVCLWQMVKNAPAENVRIGLSEENGYRRLTVEDDGSGILDTNGRPLAKERLPEIFGGFSTSGGGLGLQVARRLTELDSGYIDVVTRTEGSPAIGYSTRNGSVYVPDANVGRGTRFSLQFPL